jgi:phospholipid/cholesterol/gamma-HCH transport system substrate-binding protein
MLAALAALMYGILILGKLPSLGAAKPYEIKLVSANANGIGGGAKVDLNGVGVGQVKNVGLVKDASGKLVVNVTLQIDGGTDIPSNAVASLGKPQLGGSYVSLSVPGEAGAPLPKDGTGMLKAEAGDSGLIPKDVRDNLAMVSTQLGKVAADLHVLLDYNTPEEIASADPKDPNRPVENVSTLVVRLNRTMKSLEGLLTDDKLHVQIREVFKNLSESSSQLKATLLAAENTLKGADKSVAKFGDTAQAATDTLNASQKQILRVSEKLVDALGQMEKTMKQVSEGQGTTGKLINDPRLYEGLVDLSKSMKTTVDDLDFLLKKWKDEGVNLKLK